MITVCLGFAIFKYSENGTMTVFAEGSIQGYADGSATDGTSVSAQTRVYQRLS
jgi:hypothetical protein